MNQLNTYTIEKDGSLILLHDGTLAAVLAHGEAQKALDSKPKRSYVKRGLTDSSKSKPYQNARRRALQALKERHEQEYEALFAEELRWYLG